MTTKLKTWQELAEDKSVAFTQQNFNNIKTLVKFFRHCLNGDRKNDVYFTSDGKILLKEINEFYEGDAFMIYSYYEFKYNFLDKNIYIEPSDFVKMIFNKINPFLNKIISHDMIMLAITSNCDDFNKNKHFLKK